MFLETLLAARERITLSYVARDRGHRRAEGPVVGRARRCSTGCSSPSARARRARRSIVRARAAAGAPRGPRGLRGDPRRRARAPGGGAGRVAAAGQRRRAPAAAAGRAARRCSAPDAWASVAADLDWVAPPAAAAADARAARADADRSTPLLECPLQASARVLLPVGDDDDAMAEAEAALREHEPLDEARGDDRPVPSRRARRPPGRARPTRTTTGGSPRPTIGPADIKTARRDAPRRPVRAARCASGTWACSAAGATASCEATGGLLAAPAPIWLGAAPEHRRDVAIRPALPSRLADGHLDRRSADARSSAPVPTDEIARRALAGSARRARTSSSGICWPVPHPPRAGRAGRRRRGAPDPRASSIRPEKDGTPSRRGAPLLRRSPATDGARLPGRAGLRAAARRARLLSPLRGGLLPGRTTRTKARRSGCASRSCSCATTTGPASPRITGRSPIRATTRSRRRAEAAAIVARRFGPTSRRCAVEKPAPEGSGDEHLDAGPLPVPRGAGARSRAIGRPSSRRRPGPARRSSSSTWSSIGCCAATRGSTRCWS